MQEKLVVVCDKIDQSDIVRFCEDLGGHQNPGGVELGGVVARGEARLYVDCLTPTIAGFTMRELAKIGRTLGCLPEAVVDIHTGHHGESHALADEIEKLVSAKWHGTPYPS